MVFVEANRVRRDRILREITNIQTVSRNFDAAWQFLDSHDYLNKYDWSRHVAAHLSWASAVIDYRSSARANWGGCTVKRRG